MKKIEFVQWILLIYKLSEMVFKQSNISWWLVFLPTLFFLSGFILFVTIFVYIIIWSRIVDL